MNVVSTALGHRRLISDNVTLRMLRADLLSVVAAVLGKHLGTPGTRLAAEELHERVEADLELLRDHFDLGRKNAKAYCDDWRASGVLIRRPAVGARGETYELSADGFSAFRMLEQIEQPRTTVTESRLNSLANALRQLVADTDPDSTRRIQALERERLRIDAEIARVKRGEVDVLDPARAMERVDDVLLQAQDLPADFTRVRARFEQLNHDLRARILDDSASQSAILGDIFRGVDLIESSDEGRTFSAFAALIRDPERSGALEDDIVSILDREFAEALPVEQRRALRALVRDMKAGSRDVHSVLTEFARGLRRYVHSQEFQRDRVLRAALQEALAAALPARTAVKPYADIGVDIEISAMRLSSSGEVLPFDPGEFDTGDPLRDDEPAQTDWARLAAIARESEIDFVELVANVNDVVKPGEPVSVGEILRRHPATQGVASVIGLLSLAAQHGLIDRTRNETLTWQGLDGQEREGVIEAHFFTGRVDT